MLFGLRKAEFLSFVMRAHIQLALVVAAYLAIKKAQHRNKAGVVGKYGTDPKQRVAMEMNPAFGNTSSDVYRDTAAEVAKEDVDDSPLYAAVSRDGAPDVGRSVQNPTYADGTSGSAYDIANAKDQPSVSLPQPEVEGVTNPLYFGKDTSVLPPTLVATNNYAVKSKSTSNDAVKSNLRNTARPATLDSQAAVYTDIDDAGPPHFSLSDARGSDVNDAKSPYYSEITCSVGDSGGKSGSAYATVPDRESDYLDPDYATAEDASGTSAVDVATALDVASTAAVADNTRPAYVTMIANHRGWGQTVRSAQDGPRGYANVNWNEPMNGQIERRNSMDIKMMGIGSTEL